MKYTKFISFIIITTISSCSNDINVTSKSTIQYGQTVDRGSIDLAQIPIIRVFKTKKIQVGAVTVDYPIDGPIHLVKSIRKEIFKGLDISYWKDRDINDLRAAMQKQNDNGKIVGGDYFSYEMTKSYEDEEVINYHLESGYGSLTSSVNIEYSFFKKNGYLLSENDFSDDIKYDIIKKLKNEKGSCYYDLYPSKVHITHVSYKNRKFTFSLFIDDECNACAYNDVTFERYEAIDYLKKSDTQTILSQNKKSKNLNSTNIKFVQDREIEDNQIYIKVQKKAEYPGGMNGLRTYLSKSLVYPKTALNTGMQGTVIVQFTVEKNGTVSDVEVVRSIDPALDKEAVRVVKLMNNWKPAQNGEKTVRSKFKLPVAFKIG